MTYTLELNMQKYKKNSQGIEESWLIQTISNYIQLRNIQILDVPSNGEQQ